MHFGKTFKSQQVEHFEGQYVDYAALKKCIKSELLRRELGSQQNTTSVRETSITFPRNHGAAGRQTEFYDLMEKEVRDPPGWWATTTMYHCHDWWQ